MHPVIGTVRTVAFDLKMYARCNRRLFELFSRVVPYIDAAEYLEHFWRTAIDEEL